MMEPTTKIGIYPPVPPDIYPKVLSVLDDAGEYIRSLKEDKALIINRAQSEDENIRIQLGILYFLLTERNQCQYEIKDLIIISRDSLKLCSNQIFSIVSECWTRINVHVRSNILNLLVDLLPFPTTESLFNAVFKRMITGDLSQTNLSLVENMLVLIEEHRDVLLKDRKLISVITYTYLRLIPTHYQFSIGMHIPNNNVARLCRKEIAMVVDIIKNNFDDVFRLGGRDMMFVLLHVTAIPEFKAIWLEMCQNIDGLSHYFTDISEIFIIGTPKNVLQTSIPFEMETWILWMMRNVHHCSSNPYKRYQDLFNKRFFSTIESQNLRPFLIRFIIRVFYPDNEMIGSTLISRWATISWLIVQSNSQVVVANCKLALIYDWLFYDNKYDCIMDIEPAILAIMHNLNKYSNVSITLVDFIVKSVNELVPSIRDKIAARFRYGLNEAIRVSVFRSLAPLFEVLKHHPDLHKQFNDLINDTPSTTIATAAANTTTAISSTNVTLIAPNNVIPTIQTPATPTPQLTSTSPQILSTNTPLTASPSVPTPTPVLINNNNHITLNNNNSSVITKMNETEKNGTTNSKLLNQLSPSSKEKLEQLVNRNAIAVISPSKSNWNLFDNCTKSNAADVDICMDKKEDMTIDDLQRKFMKYSLAFDYNVERIDVGSTIGQITHNVTVSLANLFNAAQQCPSSSTIKSRHKREKKFLKKIPKKMDLDDDNDDEMSGSDEECLQDLYEKMEQVVIAILSDDDNFDDLGIAGKTAAVLCEICYPYFEKPLFPRNYPIDEEKLKASLSHPIFVLFKNICSMSSADNKREVLLLLLSEMQMRQPRIGYYLLYYLKVAKVNDPELSTYRSLCNSLEKPNLKNSLYKDLELLSKDDSKLMVFLLSDLYRAFSTEMVGNAKFAHLIITSIDATEMNLLGLEIHKNDLVMFDQSSTVELLKASLDWGTIEQYFLWELIISHNIPNKSLYGLIPYLNSKKHPEAMLKFSNILRQEKLTVELVKMLLNRNVEKGDHFTASLLNHWITKNKSKFTDILHLILSASLGHNSRDRKKKHSTSTDEQTVDLIKVLGHLDFMRQYYEDISFLGEQSIQMDLKLVVNSRSLCDDIKSRFSELLVYVEDADTLQMDEISGTCSGTGGGKVMILSGSTSTTGNTGRVLRNCYSRNTKQTHNYDDQHHHPGVTIGKKRTYVNVDSSSSTDDDEEDNVNSGDRNNNNNNTHHRHRRRFRRLTNNSSTNNEDEEEDDDEDEADNNNNNNDEDSDSDDSVSNLCKIPAYSNRNKKRNIINDN